MKKKIEKLNDLQALVIKISGIDRTIKEGTANLTNVKANITKQSDNEYTISYPGATEDTPLKYQEDFVAQLSHFGFSAKVVDLNGNTPTEQPKSLNISNTVGGLDYSEVTAAVTDENDSIPADAAIPVGRYTMTLDFSKIGSKVVIVKDWKTIGFADGTQTYSMITASRLSTRTT